MGGMVEFMRSLRAPVAVAAWLAVVIMGPIAIDAWAAPRLLEFGINVWYVIVAGGLFAGCAGSFWFFLSDVGTWKNSATPWRAVALNLTGLVASNFVLGSMLLYLIRGEGWLR